MTVGELKARLAEYADDLDVVATHLSDECDLLEVVDVGHGEPVREDSTLPDICVLYFEE